MTKKINNVFTTYLSSEELIILGNNAVSIIEEDGPGDDFNKSLLNLTKNDVETYNKIITKEKNSLYTALRKEKDQKRDDFYRAFKKIVDSSLLRSEEIREYAKKVMTVLYKYGTDLPELPFEEESLQLARLFEDCNASEIKEAINKIGASLWYSELVEAENEYQVIYKEKIEAEGKDETLTAKQARNALTFHLTALITNMNIAVEIKSGYEDMIIKLNEIIDDLMAKARARRTRLNDSNNIEQTEVTE